MCYAESADGITWTRPDLGLVEIAGSRHNNACLIEGAPHSLTKIDDFLCVLHDVDEPDVAKRYKAVFVAHVPFADIQGGRARIGPQAENWQSLVTATSADGLRWKVVGDRPVNAGGVRFEVSGLVKHDGFYYASGQLVPPWTWRRDGRPIQRVMMTYRSSDFVHWDQATALSFARAGQVITQPVEGQQTHMARASGIVAMCSSDSMACGRTGRRTAPRCDASATASPPTSALSSATTPSITANPSPITPLSRMAVKTSGSLRAAPSPRLRESRRRNDDLVFALGHHRPAQRHGNRTRDLRRDGFGDLSPMIAEEAAHCITATQPANAEGWHIKVNAHGLSEKSPLTLEVLDERGKTIPGLTATLKQSGTQMPVTFGETGRTPPSTPVAFKISFAPGSEARLYALYLE